MFKCQRSINAVLLISSKSELSHVEVIIFILIAHTTAVVNKSAALSISGSIKERGVVNSAVIKGHRTSRRSNARKNDQF